MICFQLQDERTCTGCRKAVKELFIRLKNPKMRVSNTKSKHISVSYQISIRIQQLQWSLLLVSVKDSWGSSGLLWGSRGRWRSSKFIYFLRNGYAQYINNWYILFLSKLFAVQASNVSIWSYYSAQAREIQTNRTVLHARNVWWGDGHENLIQYAVTVVSAQNNWERRYASLG